MNDDVELEDPGEGPVVSASALGRFENGAVARAQMLIADHKVAHLGWDPDLGAYRATVSGTHPYSVAVEIAPDGALVFAQCSCPVGVYCKHCYAVTFKAYELSQNRARQSRPGEADVISLDAVRAGVKRGQALMDVLKSKPFAPPQYDAVAVELEPIKVGREIGLQARVMVKLPEYPKLIGLPTTWARLNADHSLRPEQLAALEALQRVADGDPSSQYLDLKAAGPGLIAVLESLAGAGVDLVAPARSGAFHVAIATSPVELEFRMLESGYGAIVQGAYTFDGDSVPFRGTLLGRGGYTAWAVVGATLVFGPLAAAVDWPLTGEQVAQLRGWRSVSLERGQIADYITKTGGSIAGRFPLRIEIDPDLLLAAKTVGPPVLVATIVWNPNLETGTLTYRWRYEIENEDPRFFAASERSALRDHMAEGVVSRSIARAGLAREIVDRTMDLLETKVWLLDVAERLEAIDSVVVEAKGIDRKQRRASASSSIRMFTLDDWYGLSVDYLVGDETLTVGQIFERLAAGATHMITPEGQLLDLSGPEFERMRELFELAELVPGPGGAPEYRLRRYDLHTLGRILDAADRFTIPADLAAIAAAATGVELPREPVPGDLQAELRDYQRAGYDWLLFLYRHFPGGILADDMGLGKTVQALALLCHVHESAVSGPSLVIAPTSLLTNWAAEARRFAPHLKVAVIAKHTPTIAEEIDAADLVITSYPVIRLAAQTFYTRKYTVLIADEAQFVKNPKTLTHRLVADIERKFSIMCTGTPVENRIDDLFALLCLAWGDRVKEMYDLLGLTEMRRTRGAIELDVLREMLRPFILRRTKAQVLTELPPKKEIQVNLALSSQHRDRYDAGRLRVIRSLTADSSSIEALAGLTRLRMLALHPDLGGHENAEQDLAIAQAYESGEYAAGKYVWDEPAASRLGPDLPDPVPTEMAPGWDRVAKIDYLLNKLAELGVPSALHPERPDGGHAVLVFSQFTTFLEKIGDELTAQGYSYAYLDGGTVRRERVIANFTDGKARIFLISLKAGGFGLNLVQADHCFMMDPWWNAAAENQAIDRAHRIGQDRELTVHRLVAENTIEAKVNELKANKQRVADTLLGPAEGSSLADGIGAADLRWLLARELEAGK